MEAITALPSAARTIDIGRAERAVQELLTARGADTTSESLRDTPARVARMYAERVARIGQSRIPFPANDGLRGRHARAPWAGSGNPQLGSAAAPTSPREWRGNLRYR